MTDADPRILFLYGNDEYAIARRVREFSALFDNPSEAEMNTAHLDARSMTEDQWVNAVNALPFLAKQRLVLLSHPSARFARPAPRAGRADEDRGEGGENGDAARKKDSEPVAQARERFLQSLSNAPPTTQIVISGAP